MYKVEIYEKNITYHASFALEVNDADRRELERILLTYGYAFRVTPIEKEKGEDDDF